MFATGASLIVEVTGAQIENGGGERVRSPEICGERKLRAAGSSHQMPGANRTSIFGQQKSSSSGSWQEKEFFFSSRTDHRPPTPSRFDVFHVGSWSCQTKYRPNEAISMYLCILPMLTTVPKEILMILRYPFTTWLMGLSENGPPPSPRWLSVFKFQISNEVAHFKNRYPSRWFP
ncbi:hypothetical protein RUM43_011419 [Polyplax serrata]|uniref:Uncharacterized protein n=1 Tax=Polyplax serrata TaxID=468196 RepID=A0AAN8P542_POLSC